MRNGTVHRDLEARQHQDPIGRHRQGAGFRTGQGTGRRTRARRGDAIADDDQPDATRLGIILGTAAYMSPEQARGRPADKRSDIWAFGAVLYETLTGKRAFDGDDVSDTLANILKTEPDWNALPAETPSAVRRVLSALPREGSETAHPRYRRCAARPRREDGTCRHRHPPPRHRHSRIANDSRGCSLRRRSPARSPIRLAEQTAITSADDEFQIDPPDNTFLRVIRWRRRRGGRDEQRSVSPDGTRLVFTATEHDWTNRFSGCVRSTRSRRVRLTGTDDAPLPFWSPDSRSIGFFADGKLKRMRCRRTGRSKRSATYLDSHEEQRGARDVIVFSAGTPPGLARVSADGGTPVPRCNAW